MRCWLNGIAAENFFISLANEEISSCAMLALARLFRTDGSFPFYEEDDPFADIGTMITDPLKIVRDPEPVGDALHN